MYRETIEKVQDSRVIVLEPIIEERFGKPEIINAWAIEYFVDYPQIPFNEIRSGDACTYSVGTDSYAEKVNNVFRYKSGAKAGQIKAITISGSREGEIFYAYPIVCDKDGVNHPNEFSPKCINCLQEKHGIAKFRRNKSDHLSVRVGSAVRYLDPSF
jgi:hypothetical protein